MEDNVKFFVTPKMALCKRKSQQQLRAHGIASAIVFIKQQKTANVTNDTRMNCHPLLSFRTDIKHQFMHKVIFHTAKSIIHNIYICKKRFLKKNLKVISFHVANCREGYSKRLRERGGGTEGVFITGADRVCCV